MEFSFTDCTVSSRNDSGAWVVAPDGKQYFYYIVRFDEPGTETLRWLEQRGYDCGMHEALEPAGLESRDLFAIRESRASEIHERSETDQEAAFACLNWDSAPGREVRKFLDSIV